MSAETDTTRQRALLALAATAAATTIGAMLWWPAASAVVWIAKPLATTSLAMLAWLTSAPVSPRYRTLMGLGLTASLVGDVFLMLPGDRFLEGLSAFFVAHLLYLAACSLEATWLRHKAGVVGYAAVATVVLSLVLPVVGGVLRSAIIAYVIIIALMAAQATSRLLEAPDDRSARLAAIGASLFVASDALLALDRFVLIMPARDLLVLAPYWLGQAALALSVARPPAPTLRL